MDYKALLDTIADMAPAAQAVLLIQIANNLREAVDEGRLNAVVLSQVSDHLKMIVQGPRQRLQ